MKILGLILEINPFHTGHKYFIEQAKKIVQPDITIAITSTSFTMRGDVSLLSKFDKTKLLLQNGIDLVVELPVAKTLNSADFFAFHSVDILNKFGITDLAFGLENGRVDLLNKILEITETTEFQKRFSLSVQNKDSYKNTFSLVLREFTTDNEVLNYAEKPNFTLGLQYLKAIKKINNYINVHAINRVDNFYQNNSYDFKSAFTLREMFNQNLDISNYIPYHQSLLNTIDEKTLYNLIKYKFLIDNKNISQIALISEGIENYIFKNLTKNTLNDSLENLCNKRYTKSRFMRIFIASLLNIDKDYDPNEEYLRILGFNQIGLNYINTLPKTLKNRLKTTLKKENGQTGLLELQASKLYDLLTNQNTFDDEFKIPIKNLD